MPNSALLRSNLATPSTIGKAKRNTAPVALFNNQHFQKIKTGQTCCELTNRRKNCNHHNCHQPVVLSLVRWHPCAPGGFAAGGLFFVTFFGQAKKVSKRKNGHCINKTIFL
jgi:hypothetical protein